MIGALPLVSCASNELTGQVVQNSLVVTNTCPESGDTAIVVTSRPYVDFDLAPSPDELTTTTFVMEHAGAAVPFDILVRGKRWVFVPTQPLDSLELYTCSVAIGVRLVEGRLIRDFVRWSFRTGGATALDTCKVE